MNRQQFIDFMQSPEKLSGDTITLLDGLLKEFPYFQTAHLLYAKGLHNTNSIHYHNQLKIAAAYSGNRTMLYQLIMRKDKIQDVKEQHEEEVVQEIEIPKDDNEILNNLSIVSETTIENKIDAENEIIPSSPIPEEEQTKELQSLEQEFIAEAINAAVSLEIENSKEEPLPPPIKKPESEPISFTEQENKPKPGEMHSFTEWLKLADRKSMTPSEKTTSDKSTMELIDKFIKEEPKIPAAKGTFYSPVNMARKSASEDYSFVTETLAKIYLKQGSFLKALKAYENLILKYPEKRFYFAAQIESIKKLINQQK